MSSRLFLMPVTTMTSILLGKVRSTFPGGRLTPLTSTPGMRTSVSWSVWKVTSMEAGTIFTPVIGRSRVVTASESCRPFCLMGSVYTAWMLSSFSCVA